MGIGGAIMNVPILKFFGYSINKAIGSAAAIGFIIALSGVDPDVASNPSAISW